MESPRKPVFATGIIMATLGTIIIGINLFYYALIFQISASILWAAGIVCIGLYLFRGREVEQRTVEALNLAEKIATKEEADSSVEEKKPVIGETGKRRKTKGAKNKAKKRTNEKKNPGFRKGKDVPRRKARRTKREAKRSNLK